MIHTAEQPFFFSVNHIIKSSKTKLIYGVRFNNVDYMIYKTHGINACEQLDENPSLDPTVFDKICEVITQIENEYKKTPPMEFINIDVFNILVRAPNPRFEDKKKKLSKK